MRIGIEALDFDSFGGGQFVSSEIIRILQELNHEVIVFSDKHFSEKEKSNLKKRWHLEDFTIARIPKLHNVSLDSIIFNIFQIRCKLDAYIAAGWLIPLKIVAKKIPIFRYAFAPHTPFMFKKFRNIAGHHQMFYFILRITEVLFNLFLDTAGKFAYSRFTFSEFIQSKYFKYYHEQYEIIHPPVDISSVYAEVNKDEKSVVCVGRIDDEKNYHVAVMLAKRYPEYHFTIMGGFRPNAKNIAVYRMLHRASRNLPNLTLKINVERDEMLNVLSKSRYFLHLMMNEHFGIVIVESLMCGLTPIVPSHSGPADIIENGYFGHCYESFHGLITNFKDYLVPIDSKKQIQRANLYTVEIFQTKMKAEIKKFLQRISI